MQSLQMRWPVPGAIGLSTTDHRQRRDRVAVLAQDVHLADLLVQRAAAQGDAERVLLHRAVSCRASPSSTSPSRARGSTCSSPPRRDLARRHAGVGQPEPVAAPPVLRRPVGQVGQLGVRPAQRHQVLVVDRCADDGTPPSPRPPAAPRARTGAPPPSARTDPAAGTRARPPFSCVEQRVQHRASVSSSSPATLRSGKVRAQLANGARSAAGSSGGNLSAGYFLLARRAMKVFRRKMAASRAAASSSACRSGSTWNSRATKRRQRARHLDEQLRLLRAASPRRRRGRPRTAPTAPAWPPPARRGTARPAPAAGQARTDRRTESLRSPARSHAPGRGARFRRRSRTQILSAQGAILYSLRVPTTPAPRERPPVARP